MRNISLTYICTAFTSVLLLTGCLKTEGTLEIKGKVTDEYTKMKIPGRNIIVQGLVGSDKDLEPVDAGQFSSDSSGCFRFTLRKIKDAYFYKFCLAGDSDYVSGTWNLGLYELEQNGMNLSFSLSKLVDLTIKIYRGSKNPASDTLSLTWESDGVSCWSLHPYKIINFGKTNNYFGQTPGNELFWIGGNVNSVVKTRVFANKKTKLFWDLIRNGKRKEITDTITCKRDVTNIVNFTY